MDEPSAAGSRQREAWDFLRRQCVATLATVSPDGQPQAATIYYVVDHRLTFYFLTKDSTRKYKNIMATPRVALVVSDPTTLTTVQAEGIATEVIDAAERDKVFVLLKESNVSAAAWPPPISKLGGGVHVMQITPRWLRWGDFRWPIEGEAMGYLQDIPLPAL